MVSWGKRMAGFWGVLAVTLLAQCLSASEEGLYTVNEDVGNRLKAYLERISSPKPLKCDEPKSLRRTSFEDVSEQDFQWFRSRKCLDNELWSGFSFTGRIDDFNRLSGPGKLSFGMNGSTPSDEFLSTCFTFPINFEGAAQITSIVGTFVNGTMEGQAKVSFSNNRGFVIAHFAHGVPHGLKRTFSESKTLLEAEIVDHNSPVGYKWRVYNNTNYLLDFTHSKETFGQIEQTTLAFLSSSNKFLGGSYPKYVDFLFDPYAPTNLVFNDEGNDCIKHLLWSKSKSQQEEEEKEVFSLKTFSLLSELPEIPEFSPDSELPAPKRLLRFRKYTADNEARQAILYRRALSPVNKEDALPFLRKVQRHLNESSGSFYYEGELNGERIEFSLENGFLDEKDLFHGPCELSILSTNLTRDTIFNATIHKIWADFDHGRIKERVIKLQYTNKRFGYVNVASNTLHGPLFIHGAVPILPVKHVIRPYISETSSTILIYKDGKLLRPFWIGMFGLGTLTGQLNDTGYVTGDAIAYIYPDMETSYIGKFENKLMREAYLGDVISVSFESPVPVLQFQISESERRPFYYEPPTNDSTGAGPEILDPYDQKRVYLSDAGEFGEGVHVKMDMEIGDIACLYNYHIYYPPDSQSYKITCSHNTSKSEDERRHCAKYALGIQILDATLNIPPEKDVPGMFLPTLGQKLNHKFYGSHASFVDFESPRWGMVSSIGLYYKPIKKGEQLYVDYGYQAPAPFPYDFPWFWEAKAKVDNEIQEAKIQEKMKLRKKMKRRKKEAKGK